MSSAWALRERTSRPLATSQILSVLSSPPLTRFRLSGLKATERTSLVCPRRTGPSRKRTVPAAGEAAGVPAAVVARGVAGEAAARDNGVAVGGGVEVGWASPQAASNRARGRDNGTNNRPIWRIIEQCSP